MERQKVTEGKSKLIAAIGYDKATQTLEVEFTAGSVYQYSGVPEETYEEFIHAESLGNFVLSRIRGAFEYKRLHLETCKPEKACDNAMCVCWCHKLTVSSRETEKKDAKPRKTKKTKTVQS